MKNIYVAELSRKSQELFKYLAEAQGFNPVEIQDGLDSKISDLDDIHNLLGFRKCENPQCKELFNEGFLTEDSDTFCSSECAEKMITDILEEDYGEYIFYTDWLPEEE